MVDFEDDVPLKKSVETSKHGVPAVGAVVRDRFETDEVFQRSVALSEHIHVDGHQFANPEPGVVHESDDRLVALLQVVGTSRVTRRAEIVDLVGSKPHFCANFGI